MVPDSVHQSAEMDETEVRKLYLRNANRIKSQKHLTKRLQDTYNFEVVNPSVEQIKHFVLEIFAEQKTAFKLNFSFGFILRNYFTAQLVYYYASNNNRVLPNPFMIQNSTDVTRFIDRLQTEDFLEYCRQHRPNTKFVVDRITNARFVVSKIRGHMIGAPGYEIPEYIKNRMCMMSFVSDKQGKRYEDNFCLFRCLVYHLEKKRRDERKVRVAVGEYCEHLQTDPNEFQGVSMSDLDVFEDFFKVNVNVYELKPRNVSTDDDDVEGPSLDVCDVVGERIYLSRLKYPGPTMNVNLFKSHFSYICNLSRYAKSWSCAKCAKLFDHVGHCTAHQRNCSVTTKLVFPGGGYGSPKRVFDYLREIGFTLDLEDTFYPYRAAFDFEAISVRCDDDTEDVIVLNSRKQKFKCRLVPASVSICSNVPGYEEAKCFISNGDPLELIARMYNYLQEISQVAAAFLGEKFQTLIDDLKAYEHEYSQLNERAEFEKEMKNYAEYDQLCSRAFQFQTHARASQMFDKWLRQLVVLGFNSGKFDINLIRKYMFPYFLQKHINVGCIIKKRNDYMSIETEDLIFLDMKNYLAAQTSYDKWIRSQDIQQTKGFFPYDWFTDLEKLEQPHLPPIEEFWSSLKQKSISPADYAHLQTVWVQKGFKTMRDLLIRYNNLDVEPFVFAAEKMFLHWKTIGIDPFKGGAISLPGLALAYLMQAMDKHTILPLFDTMHQDLYHTLRENVVGGLSVVGHRYHEAGVTFLPNGQKCHHIYSHDCNALYLWALGEPTGTGICVIWRALNDEAGVTLNWQRKAANETESGYRDRRERWNEMKERNLDLVFHAKSMYPKSNSELEWLEWMAHTHGIQMEHRFNGRQKRVQKSAKVQYPVDGYDPDTNTIYQFHGCYWHGHGCYLSKANDDDDANRKRQTTTAVTADLRAMGYSVTEYWECEWREEKRCNPRIQEFIDEHLRVKLPTSGGFSSGRNLIQSIMRGELFGLIECNVCVPWWDEELLEYFKDFPPIFKNTQVSIDDIGAYMKDYAELHGYMRKPRRSLINSYWGQKILITTPLLKWYLQNGLEVTRIYQVVQMKPKAPFRAICDAIADHRRQADRDPAYKSVGESWKTVGNSFYGKSITNKEGHKNTTIIHDSEASKYINDVRFHKIEEIGEVAYEICTDKKRIRLDLPMTIAVFVYSYAKLRMLHFVYDFLKRYLRPGSYQIVCSDTDSIVAAYESKNLDSLVMNDMREHYEKHGKAEFLVTDPYTLRTPGLFKEEWSGTGIVALCPKTYFTWSDDDSKLSTKGLSKTTNMFTKEDFLKVLETKKKGSGVNQGFRVLGDMIYQYEQEREGLAYLYIKRKVQEDGVSTEPLDL